MILLIMRSVALFPFIFLIFIQHRLTIGTPITLSKQNNEFQWNADAEFHTIRYNWLISVTPLKYNGRRVLQEVLPTTENETNEWVVLFSWGNEWDTSTFTSLHFQFDGGDKVRRIIAKIKARLLDDFGKEVRSKEELRELHADNKMRFQWKDFCRIEDITKNPYLQKDIFTISLEISHYYPRCNNFTEQRDTISLEPNTTKYHMFDNIGSLLLGNQEFADVVLQAKGKNYFAHKAVLAARSEVFATMFKNIAHGDRYKKIQVKIRPTDTNAEVMDEVMQYIYTGKCQTPDKIAEELCAVADEYKLDELKTLVLKSMVETLSTENAVNVLLFVDKHRVKGLKSRVIDFIVENSAQVLNTTEWKSMAATNFQLLDEICQFFSQRLSKCLHYESFCMPASTKK